VGFSQGGPMAFRSGRCELNNIPSMASSH
jgi:hypothetical protein